MQCDPTPIVVGLVIKGCTFKGNGLPFYRDSVGGTHRSRTEPAAMLYRFAIAMISTLPATRSLAVEKLG